VEAVARHRGHQLLHQHQQLDWPHHLEHPFQEFSIRTGKRNHIIEREHHFQDKHGEKKAMWLLFREMEITLIIHAFASMRNS